MTGETDQDIQLLDRLRLIEVLVVLAAEPDEQVAFAHERDEDVDELVYDYVDWTVHSVPRLREAGLLPPEAIELLDRLNERLCRRPVTTDYHTLTCEQAVLVPMWTDGRELARSILDLFRAAGVPVPSLAGCTHYWHPGDPDRPGPKTP